MGTKKLQRIGMAYKALGGCYLRLAIYKNKMNTYGDITGMLSKNIKDCEEYIVNLDKEIKIAKLEQEIKEVQDGN